MPTLLISTAMKATVSAQIAVLSLDRRDEARKKGKHFGG